MINSVSIKCENDQITVAVVGNEQINLVQTSSTQKLSEKAMKFDEKVKTSEEVIRKGLKRPIEDDEQEENSHDDDEINIKEILDDDEDEEADEHLLTDDTEDENRDERKSAEMKRESWKTFKTRRRRKSRGGGGHPRSYVLRPRTGIRRAWTEGTSPTPRPRRGRGGNKAPKSKYRRHTANARERERMKEINVAFANLRGALPAFTCRRVTSMTKIKTLKLAASYIQALTDLLSDSPSDESEGLAIQLLQNFSDNSSIVSSFKHSNLPYEDSSPGSSMEDFSSSVVEKDLSVSSNLTSDNISSNQCTNISGASYSKFNDCTFSKFSYLKSTEVIKKQHEKVPAHRSMSFSSSTDSSQNDENLLVKRNLVNSLINIPLLKNNELNNNSNLENSRYSSSFENRHNSSGISTKFNYLSTSTLAINQPQSTGPITTNSLSLNTNHSSSFLQRQICKSSIQFSPETCEDRKFFPSSHNYITSSQNQAETLVNSSTSTSNLSKVPSICSNFHTQHFSEATSNFTKFSEFTSTANENQLSSQPQNVHFPENSSKSDELQKDSPSWISGFESSDENSLNLFDDTDWTL